MRDEAEWKTRLAPVYAAMRQTRAALAPEKALIGFAGAPWTLAAYMLEGKGSPDQRQAKLAAYRDPQGFERLLNVIADAVAWHLIEQLKAGEALVFADELDIHLLPKVGCAWMPKGTQLEVMTPGQNQKHYLAGALDLTTGTLHHCLGPRKTNALFRNLLTRLDERYPPGRYRRLYVVVDNYKIHKAKAVEPWLAAHPRVSLLFLPTYCPQANPIERAFGDVHDCCTRNHRRNRLLDLVADVEDHLDLNGPWKYKLSDLYYEPAVTTAVENITAKEQAKVAA